MEKSSKILITGAQGLVGSAVIERLRNSGYRNVIGITRSDCDLMNRNSTETVFSNAKPDYVFHAAARVYGIGGNIANQGKSFFENVVINTNVIHATHLVGARKITVMGTGAVYPYPSPSLPLREADIFLGRPHGAEEAYAQAKRAALAMLEAYQSSYGLKWAYVVSCNLFGPNDKFDVEYGHVVPALVRKFYEAKKAGAKVTVWGDGTAQRDFLYVKDCAAAVEIIMEVGEGPINIGSGRVVRIGDIVTELAEISGMQDAIQWDSTKPNGQDYRAYDLTKVSSLGYKSNWLLKQGLRETWEWYCRNADQ